MRLAKGARRSPAFGFRRPRGRRNHFCSKGRAKWLHSATRRQISCYDCASSDLRGAPKRRRARIIIDVWPQCEAQQRGRRPGGGRLALISARVRAHSSATRRAHSATEQPSTGARCQARASRPPDSPHYNNFHHCWPLSLSLYIRRLNSC